MNESSKQPDSGFTVDLPESVRELAETAAADGGYSSVAEYIEILIRADQASGSGTMERLLIELVESASPEVLERVASALCSAVARREDERARDNLREALGLLPVGLDLGRQRLRAQFPGASEEEIERRLRELLSGGEGATPWFRPVSKDRLRRLAPE